MESASNDDPVHHLDANDTIVFVNDAWKAFAAENHAPDLANAVLGSSLWEHIHGPTAIECYKQLIEAVRASGKPLSLPFRCDSPSQRRYLELEISLVAPAGTVAMRCAILRTEPRDPVPVPIEAVDAPLICCAWCKRVEWDGAWRELEEAARAGLFLHESSALYASHGICEDCWAAQARALTQLRE